MKTYNQFLETPFSEEIKPPEPQEEDPSIKSKEKRQMQIKKQVLLKKLQSVRAGAGADIVAGYEPEGEVLDELKTPTLLSYTQKAANKLAFHGDGSKKAQNRATGVKRAASRLTRRAQDPKGEFGWNKNVKQEEVVHEGDYHSGQGEKIQKRTKKWMDKKGMKGAPGLDAMKARTAEHKAKRGVKEGTDKAFEYVKKQIAAKYGKSGYVSKDNPRKPQTAAEKAKVRAHQAKVDKENAAERAKDPSQGRYPKG